MGWQGFDQVRHRGEPTDIEQTYGIWVEYSNPEDDEDYGRFWIYTFYGEFEDWSEWWLYIGAYMEQHGLDLAV